MSAPSFSPDQLQSSFDNYQRSAEEFVPQPHAEFQSKGAPAQSEAIDMSDFNAALSRAHDALHTEGLEASNSEKLPPGVAERLGDLASRGVAISAALDPTNQEAARAAIPEQQTSQTSSQESSITSRLG